MNFFLKHKIVILRSLGALMLLIGLAVNFWETPKQGLSANDKAAARIARMEASLKSKSSSGESSSKKDTNKFLKAIQDTQTKESKYLTIFTIVFGVGFLGYSFLPRKEEERT